MGICDVCSAEVGDEELYRCGECGKTYCEKCAVADGTIKELGEISFSKLQADIPSRPHQRTG